MKSFQHFMTVIALTILASHQAVAAPASENQAFRPPSDSQSAVFPPSGNVAISNIGTVGNQVGVISGNIPPNAVVISKGGNIQLDGTNAVDLNSSTVEKFSESIINNVNNQLARAFGKKPSAVADAGV